MNEKLHLWFCLLIWIYSTQVAATNLDELRQMSLKELMQVTIVGSRSCALTK